MDAPVIIEPNVPNPLSEHKAFNTDLNHNETGFPFDDSDFDRDRNSSFSDTLDDIAKRHPEFAQHLNFDNKFPSGSNTWGHKRRGEHTKPRRFAEFTDHFDHPSSSRFKEKFGFPFGSSSFDEAQYFPEQKPNTSQEQQQKPEETAKPPQVPTAERGRKQNPNLPQSSTVDLGQKQEPVCEIRGQRSMSAPPENRAGPRFVSSINIPINTDGANEPQSQQHPQQSKPTERVIPIHVEGRDEPVMPKNPNQTFTQASPQNERGFGPKPSNYSQWKRTDSPYYTGEGFSPEPHFDARQQFFTGQPQQRANADQHPNTAYNKQQQQAPKSQTPPPAQQQKSATPPPQPQPPKGPISQIQCIQRDVLELMGQVEKFNGQPKDREYMYLDEMLTRNLLKLDDIDTEGKENIRHARKEAINCIQKCISILEAKALANEQLRNVMEVDNTKTEEITSAPSVEVSAVSRSGSESACSQQMEVGQTPASEEAAESAPSETQETEVEKEAPPQSDVQMEETTSDQTQPSAEENVESSQEAPKVTKDKKKVKKKENVAEQL